jgi:hypothetical protein
MKIQKVVGRRDWQVFPILNVQIILGVTFYLLKIIGCDKLNNNKLACDIFKICYYYV